MATAIGFLMVLYPMIQRLADHSCFFTAGRRMADDQGLHSLLVAITLQQREAFGLLQTLVVCRIGRQIQIIG
ncbi:hypothetical protein D3C80_1939490 [compost metagenome]